MKNDNIRQLKLNNINLKNNVFLAPMAGVTDIAFRNMCRKYNPALTFTEMASTKAMEFNSVKTERLLQIGADERPSAVQIFGNNPDVIKNTILKLNDNEEIDIIDINMGCPAPKLVKNGDGAGLLLDLDNVARIIEIATKVSKKVITVKTRKGFDNTKITAVKVAKICEDLGIPMITVHGRTREEYYSGISDLDIIKEVKSNVKILVIGNGDIVDLKSANKMFEYTNCDGIMIARGAMGNPWIFKSILEGEEYIPTISELFETIRIHIKNQIKLDGEKQANLKLRKHIAWYLKGLKGNSNIKDMVNKAEDLGQVLKILAEYELFLKSLEE